jgi:thiol:disulfide interchange protein
MSNRNTDAEYDRDEDVEEYDPTPSEQGKWVSAVIALIGVWMLAEAFLFDVVPGQFWNDVIVGGLLLAVGGYNYYRRANEEIGSVGAAAVAALVGLWLVAAPFLFGAQAGLTEATNALAFWNDIVVGLLALGLGAYSAYEAREQREEVTGTLG